MEYYGKQTQQYCPNHYVLSELCLLPEVSGVRKNVTERVWPSDVGKVLLDSCAREVLHARIFFKFVPVQHSTNY